ncbi:MAG: protein kinase [Pirellulaceae bacterium]|nr:MAG: protein kinase [Pirellulaceae bacterium]
MPAVRGDVLLLVCAMVKVRDFIGPYRLTRLIRVGNSCAVWEAVRESDNARFALKVLRQDLRKDKQELAFLRHEFEVASRLSHPNVIRMYEFNLDGEVPYLVLELYSEHNLKQALRTGIEPWWFYFQKIIEQAAEALYHVHEHGWVHCDVKPDNFLVSSEGEIKLIDFTIAQKMGTSRLGWFRFGKTFIRGTRSYMSPEQIRGKRLDARSDIYSLGCVMFELLGGRPPFTGNNPDELLEKHLYAAIPNIQALNNNVTTEAADLIRRMMSKKAEDRPPNMWEFLKEFRTIKVFRRAPRRPGEVEQPDEATEPEGR